MVVRACRLLATVGRSVQSRLYFIPITPVGLHCNPSTISALERRMPRFFSLFHCESYGSNRSYEDRFQWFFVHRDEKNNLLRVESSKISQMLQLVKEPTNVAPLGALTRFLGNSLEPRAYELFLEEIGILVIEIFYEDSVEDADGFPDDVKTKELHYRKYCLFKFASFLDLLCPDSVHWRGQAELEREPLIRTGLDRFQSAGPQARASMLSRWIKQPGPSAFSEKRAERSQRVMERRAFLLKLDNLTAGEVAERFDGAGFKPQKWPSYTNWFSMDRRSFESWLSKERTASRKAWRP